MGFNRAGCVIASDTLFGSRGGFFGSTYPMKTAEIAGLRDVAMATAFGTTLAVHGL